MPRLLIVDKPVGVPVHGGDEARRDDVVSRLGEWLRAQGRSPYLGVHQRLDQTTSGALFFTLDDADNAVVAEAMERHRVERTYVAVVREAGSRRLKKEGRLEHRLNHERGMTKIVRSGGKRAVTQYRVLGRVGERALVELRPQTGRTHQLRVQLAAAGAPICGDTLYGGEPAPRVFLHARSLGGGPVGSVSEAPVPEQFQAWLERARIDVPEDLSGLLGDAGARRVSLRDKTDVYRLVNGIGDGLPGLTVDVCAEWAVLSIYDASLVDRAESIAEQTRSFGLRGVYLKTRVRADLRREDADELAPNRPLVGDEAPDEVIVCEEGVRFALALGDGLSTGLFVDQRENRSRLAKWAAGGPMLNLFCYTGSFSVYAALGGATGTVSVDLSGKALERARRNFALNGLEGTEHRFFKEDAFKWLRRAVRRGDRFRTIVLDPPTFSTVGKGTFSVAKRYGEAANLAFQLLEPGGRLLAVTNHTKTSTAALRRILHEAARGAGREVRTMKDLPSSLDCPAFPEGPWPSKSVVSRVA